MSKVPLAHCLAYRPAEFLWGQGKGLGRIHRHHGLQFNFVDAARGFQRGNDIVGGGTASPADGAGVAVGQTSFPRNRYGLSAPHHAYAEIAGAALKNQPFEHTPVGEPTTITPYR